MRKFSLDKSLIQELTVIIKESIDSGEDTDSFIRNIADFLIDNQGLREHVNQVIIEDERAPGSKVKETYGKNDHNLYFYRICLMKMRKKL